MAIYINGVAPIGLNRLNSQANRELLALFSGDTPNYRVDEVSHLLIAINVISRNFGLLDAETQEKILFEKVTEEDIQQCISQLTTFSQISSED